MRPHLTLSQLRNFKPTALAGVLLAAFLSVCAVGIVSSTAQSTQRYERGAGQPLGVGRVPRQRPLNQIIPHDEARRPWIIVRGRRAFIVGERRAFGDEKSLRRIEAEALREVR